MKHVLSIGIILAVFLTISVAAGSEKSQTLSAAAQPRKSKVHSAATQPRKSKVPSAAANPGNSKVPSVATGSEKENALSENLAQWVAQICSTAGHPLTQVQIARIRGMNTAKTGKSKDTLASILTNDQERALQAEFRERAVKSVTELLNETDHPLTPEQKERLRTMDLNTGKHETADPIFTEEQRQALQKNLWEEAAGKLAERMSLRLTKAGQPLSSAQMEQIKKLQPEEGALDNLLAILSDDQEQALWKSYESDPAGKAVMHVLELQMVKAKCPLTPEQRKQIRSLVPGKGSPFSILTGEQNNELHSAWRRILDLHFPEGLATRLEKAGYPLSPEQAERLKLIQSGKGNGEQISDVLTPEQRNILEKTRTRVNPDSPEKSV